MGIGYGGDGGVAWGGLFSPVRKVVVRMGLWWWLRCLGVVLVPHNALALVDCPVMGPIGYWIGVVRCGGGGLFGGASDGLVGEGL